MAEHRPAEVRQVYSESSATTTVWAAKVLLLDAALRMPVAESRAIASAIQSQLDGELDPNVALNVVTFIEQLAGAGETPQAMRLAQTLLRPPPSPPTLEGSAAGQYEPELTRTGMSVLCSA